MATVLQGSGWPGPRCGRDGLEEHTARGLAARGQRGSGLGEGHWPGSWALRVSLGHIPVCWMSTWDLARSPEHAPAPGGLRAGQQAEEPAAGTPRGAGAPGDPGGRCPPHPRGRRDLQPQPLDQAPVHRWGPGAQRRWSARGAPPQSTRSCEGPGAPRVLPDCSDPLPGHSPLSLKGAGPQSQAG